MTSTFTMEMKDLSGATVISNVLAQSPECTVGFALNNMGTISFRLPLTGTNVTRANYLVGERTLTLKQDGTPVWGGFLLAAKADKDWVTFSGKDWLFGLTQAIISDNRRYNEVEQLDIAWDLITDFVPAVVKPTRASAVGSGKVRTYTVCCDDLVTVYDAVSELSNYWQGFDFWVTPGNAWTTAYGFRGTDVSGSVTFDDTVNFTNATVTHDSEYEANRCWFTVPSMGACGDLQYRDQGGSPDGTWIREVGVDLADIKTAGSRNDRVDEVLRNSQTILQAEGTVDAQTGVEFGDFGLGDTVHLTMSKGYNTIDQDMKVLQYTATIKEACVQEMRVVLDNLVTA